MHQIPGLKKKVYLTMTLLIVIFLFAVNSKYDVIQCNLHRDYKSINDRYFQDVKDKITKLENEKLKDPTTIGRLAEQYNLIGSFYLERRLWDMTIDSFDSSIKYGNKKANAFYSLGLAYANRGIEKNSTDDINKAEYNYRKAVETDPGLLDAKYALSILLFYHREKGKDEALTLINQILANNRAYYPARFANGRFNYELGNKQKALMIYQELSSDLDKLPSSGISNDYKKECKNNITRIMTELSMQ